MPGSGCRGQGAGCRGQGAGCRGQGAVIETPCTLHSAHSVLQFLKCVIGVYVRINCSPLSAPRYEATLPYKKRDERISHHSSLISNRKTVYCVLCTVYCVLCTVYCVLYSSSSKAFNRAASNSLPGVQLIFSGRLAIR
jgi:hypothetical protein